MAIERIRPRALGSVIALALAVGPGAALAATYSYRDESGTFRMVSDRNQIPVRFRDSARRLDDGSPSGSPRDPASSPSGGDGTRTSAPAAVASAAAIVPATAPKPPPTVIRSRGLSNGHIVVDAKFGRNVFQKMMVDTGASITAISVDTAKRLDAGAATALSFIAAQTAAGGVVLPVIRVRSMTVGEATVEDMPVVVNPHLGEEGLLGIDFLGQFTSQVDAGSQTLTLAPLDTSPRPGFFGGHTEDWWRGRYATLTTSVTMMRAAREAVARELSTGKYAHFVDRSGRKVVSPERARELLDGAVTFWEAELRALKNDAAGANLPRGLR